MRIIFLTNKKYKDYYKKLINDFEIDESMN